MSTTPASEEGVLVGTGSFLVDRKQALEKLMRFQLQNPAGFALPWLRCAAASGATLFSIERRGGVLVTRFDGRPLRREDLGDPYRWLFERPGPAVARSRMLAVGLLSALGLKPSLLRVSSGKGAARIALRLYSLEREEFDTPAPGRETVIEAGIGGTVEEAVRLLREGCGLSKLKVTIDGEVQPDWQAGGHRLTFQNGAAHGWVAVPLSLEDRSAQKRLDVDLLSDRFISLNVAPVAIADSSIKLYSHGVLIERLKLNLPVAPVAAAINDDSLVLNASQSGVVRDKAFRQAIQRLDEPTRELIRSEARWLAQSLPAIASRLGEFRVRRMWRETIEPQSHRGHTIKSAAETTLSLLQNIGRGPQKQYLRRVEETALVVRWLRDVAAVSSLLNSPREAAALRAAPLFMGFDGGTLSLDDLADEVHLRSYLPYSLQPAWGAALGFRALWAMWPGEEQVASQLLGARERDMTGVVKRHQAAAHDPNSATFEQAGLPAPLIRSELHAAEYFGEVGLLAEPPAQGQLHLLTEGIPSGLIEEGSLRFTAVVTGPNNRWESLPLTTDVVNRQLFAEARAAAERLYPKLAEELDPADSSASGAAIRAHLLDFLAIELETHGADAAAGSPSWIANQPLFLTPDGASSWTQILARIEKGEIVYASRQRPDHPPNRGFWIMGAPFAEGLLTRFFPRNTLAPAGQDVLAVLRRPSASCQTADGVCAFAFRAGDDTFHAACRDNPFSWKTVTLHAIESSSDIAVELGGHEELIIQLMTALIRQAGTLHDQPDHPLRRLLIKLLALQPPPWPGSAGQELWSVLRGQPFFRGSADSWMLEDIHAALQDPSARLTYAVSASTPADLILDKHELEALRHLTPVAEGRLAPYGEPALSLPVMESSEPLVEPEAPAAKAIDIAKSGKPKHPSVRAGFRGAKVILRKGQFLFERRYQSFGLDVWLGIPMVSPPPKPAFVPGGRADFDISNLPPLAWVFVDATEWVNTDSVPALPILTDMLRSLYSELADCWPVIRPGGLNSGVIRRYVLEAAYYAGADKRLIATWGSVREKLLKLTLFKWSDGRPASLYELGQSSRTQGTLGYPDSKAPTPAQWRLITAILGDVEYKKVKNAPRPAAAIAPDKPSDSAAPRDARSMASTRPSWLQSIAGQLPAIDLACRLLTTLHGRKGLRLPHHRSLRVSRLSLSHDLPHSPLTIAKSIWVLDERHPLVSAVLQSPLSPQEQAPYLASIAFTAANRLMTQVTDEDDIRFQDALSILLAPSAEEAPE